ncbi:MAG: hydrogenase maturation protease [Alphaproteobacteria bacterium]|nr:hydrogenase maturation protease [Alphaproteobacteria bacterium]
MADKFLLIGIGNRDRGDDAVGPLMAEKLAQDERLLRLGVRVTPHSGEGASLMELWQGARKAVIIDAMKSGSAVGSVRRFDVAGEKLAGGLFRYSSHLFSLAEAVEMARLLNRLPESLIIYGIEGRAYDFGAALSPGVAAALPGVEEAVCGEFLPDKPCHA